MLRVDDLYVFCGQITDDLGDLSAVDFLDFFTFADDIVVEKLEVFLFVTLADGICGVLFL